MVDIIRRKNVNLQSPDVSSGAIAMTNAVKKIGEGIGKLGEKYSAKLQKEEEKADKEYQEQVKQNLKTEQDRLVSEQKAFDASDKIVAADRIGRLKNDLLRWNMAQRENNPNYIGTPEHERAMRDEYSRLSSKYGAGLGEAGSAEFTEKTQSAVNDFINNDVKWAYRQKIKQGEESAKKIAETMNQNAAMYGANGDVEGFKEAHKEGREQLKDYINDVAPAGAAQALKELDRKSLIDFYTNLAQTDPVKAKALLDSMENFQTTVPDDMLQAANDTTTQAVNRDLNDKLILVNAGIENTKKDRKQQKELEKQKKQIEKDIKKALEEDYTEKSLSEIHKEVSDAVAPVLEKSLGESALIAKKEHEEEKVARFGEFMKLPTPETLHWFEEDNQMSYAQPEENMSKLPDDFFSYGDQGTLKDYYDMYKGRYADKQKEKRTLLKAGIANAPKNSQERADLERKKEKLEEEMANEDKTILSNANEADLERIDKLVSGGMSEIDAVEKVFNETEEKIAQKAKQRRANELLDNMMKYRENFGNVSMVEISDYKGTKQMFDDFKKLAQTDSDKDGNTDNVLLKALVAVNNAKESEISEKDYNDYLNNVAKILYDTTYKAEVKDFIQKTADFMPKKFWENNGRYLVSKQTEINERMNSGTRDVLLDVLQALNNGATSADAAQMYKDGIEKAYNSVVSATLGINMEQIKENYKLFGYAPATINGMDYLFKGVDPEGNPIWEPINYYEKQLGTSEYERTHGYKPGQGVV